MQSGYGKKVEGPKRTHIIVEMVVRILAILVRYNTDTKYDNNN